jgi:hypothetical protein
MSKKNRSKNNTSTETIEDRLLFKDAQHEIFFYWGLAMAGDIDKSTQALMYTIGLSKETRDNIKLIYNFKEKRIETGFKDKKWADYNTSCIFRMAYNLYMELVPVKFGDGGDPMEKVREFSKYTPNIFFRNIYAPYFWEAIKLKFPEYCILGRQDEIEE